MKFFETLLSGLKAIILSHSYSKKDSDAKYLTKDKQAQPDWKESNSKSPAYIKNKPNLANLVGKNGTGYGAEIFNDYANNVASDKFSHAEGCNTTASGNQSHAEGYGTIAFGWGSHAEGLETKANYEGAHAEGSNTIASGATSHAEGTATKAIGYASHAEGYNTIASGESQHVQGKYNIEDTSNKYVHIVGKGISNSKRSNAHTLDWEGNAWYAGTLKLGGTSYDDASEVALKSDIQNIDISNAELITVEDIDNICGANIMSVNGVEF